MSAIKKQKELTRKEILNELWRQGVLDWKLKDVQKKVKEDILNDTTKTSVVLMSRRNGKSYLMLTMAIEQCIKKPNSIVKYVFPLQKDAKTVIRPLMRMILEPDEDQDAWCPKNVKPEWKEQDKCYVFPNGSVIQMTGSDNGSIDNVRGGFSDACIVDEAGFVDDLKYGVRSVLGPTTKTTGGRIILVSTPSKNADHDFITSFVMPYLAAGRLKIYTIHDNPNVKLEDALEDYPDGDKDPDFRREYLCALPFSSERAILHSFSPEKAELIVKEGIERPPYFDRYVSMDLGFKDLTGVLFGYYDYMKATLVIEDEIVLEQMNTEKLAELIVEKERELYKNPIDNSIIAPYRRVSDNNLIVINDLRLLHGLEFVPTKKDNKQAAINALDIDIANDRVIIHPRCKNLLYHMRFAEWNRQGTEFKRLRDDPNTKLKGGHADLLDCLIYMHRNVIKSHNPYPFGWGEMTGENIFRSRNVAQTMSDTAKAFKNIFKIK